MDAFVVRSKRASSQSPRDKHLMNNEIEFQSGSDREEIKHDISHKNDKRRYSDSFETAGRSLEGKCEDSEAGEKKLRRGESSGKKPRLTDIPVQRNSLNWRTIKGENLSCDYCILLSKTKATALLRECETSISYNTGKLAQVQIFGKWRDIPRKQVAFGDPGLSYTFSGNKVPARPWLPFLEAARDHISEITGHRFNFVLINRYENGNDNMGEHRDDEKDLVKTSPIASLTLGQSRDFVFKHAASRGKDATRQIPTVKVELEHGSLLMMNYPTNTYWYHSLPKRKNAVGVRINMTFRDFVVKQNT